MELMPFCSTAGSPALHTTCSGLAETQLVALSRWWERWKLHRSYDASTGVGVSPSGRQSPAPEPGAIDNEPLLLKGDPVVRRELKDNLEEGVHFTILSRPAWNHLVAK